MDQSIIDKIYKIEWGKFAQPEENKPGSVSRALISMANCHDEASSNDACNAVLFALGNNHGGTYFPVAIEAIPIFRELIASKNTWTRGAVLEVLIDYYQSFYPDPAFATFLGADGKTHLLEDLMNQEISKLSPLLETIVVPGAQGLSRREVDSARELLKIIRTKSRSEFQGGNPIIVRRSV